MERVGQNSYHEKNSVSLMIYQTKPLTKIQTKQDYWLQVHGLGKMKDSIIKPSIIELPPTLFAIPVMNSPYHFLMISKQHITHLKSVVVVSVQIKSSPEISSSTIVMLQNDKQKKLCVFWVERIGGTVYIKQYIINVRMQI